MNDSPIRIELLYFDGCLSYRTAWAELLEVIVEYHLDALVRPINVDRPEQADALQFAGSPSIKINDEDLKGYDGQGVMACRVYEENGRKGWPSKALLVTKLLTAKDA